jgi:Mg-chelatase subunit ChlD
MSFTNFAWMFMALALVPLFYLTRRTERIRVSAGGVHKTSLAGQLLMGVPQFCTTLAVVLAAVTLCQPFITVNEKTNSTVQGRDIILALDWSSSMVEPYKGERKVRKHDAWYDPYARAGRPATSEGGEGENAKEFRRIDAAQDAIVSFAETRRDANTGDHIGLILFDYKPELRWPLDRDLKQITRHGSFLPKGKGQQELGVGTNFGTTMPGPFDKASEHFELKGKSSTRVLILITDGENEMDDKVISRLRKVIKDANMKVYVIGVGEKIGKGELSLERLCKSAGGEVFRAENQADLDQCFAKINALESSPIPVTGDKSFEPVFYNFLIAAMVFFAVSLCFEALILGR